MVGSARCRASRRFFSASSTPWSPWRRSLPANAARHACLKRGLAAIHRQSLREHGVTLSDERIDDLLALDFELNAQGIGIWLDRLAA